MTVLDANSVLDLIKSVGPTDEHRQTFGRTFIGSLLGQATIFVGMMVAYVVAIVLLWKYASDDLRALYATVGMFWFWSIMATPIVFILLFSMLPTGWRALRERRLKTATIGGDVQFKPGYFRLHPYGAADRGTFKRLDGADSAIWAWLKSTKASLLYLSGASGVGKSSLLAANVLPQLRDSGWMVIETSLFGDPIERLRAALLAADSRLTRKPAAELSLLDLLTKAVEARGKRRDAPLLLVIDQFEEFLILYREEECQDFAAFLSELVKSPIDDLRILLVFRSDYRPLVFKLDLPPLIAGQNWHELAPYDRGEATAFLQSGGRELSSQAIDRLFRGLDRIEDAPGMYRPITLNMVGLVLERMGRTLEGDPGRLIQSYLMACITTSESRDFAKPLLAQMITDAGTKEARSEADLARLTGLDPWQVKATLADLARHGLVRRLEAATAEWEIAHDFLARIIGQLIGRLKPNVIQRVRPMIAPVVLLGWIALAVLALPYWTTLQERTSEAALRQLGASFGQTQFGGLYIDFRKELTDQDLTQARPHLERINPSGLAVPSTNVTSLEPLKGLVSLRLLDLHSVTAFVSLEPIKGLMNLELLRLAGASRIINLEPLAGLTNLRSLDLSSSTVTSLEPLKGLTNLSGLDLTHSTGFTTLEPLRGLTNLRWLHLSGNITAPKEGITTVEPIEGLTNLETLALSYFRNAISLDPLKGLTNLRSLNLSESTGITSLGPLKGLTNLSSLDLSNATGITSLEPLKGLPNLSSLNLFNANGITSLEPLKELPSLRSLNLGSLKDINKLEPLKELTNLEFLDLSYTDITSLELLKELTNLRTLYLKKNVGIRSLEPLRGLTKLSSLDLYGAISIRSLEPLKGREISIKGASRELLATMN